MFEVVHSIRNLFISFSGGGGGGGRQGVKLTMHMRIVCLSVLDTVCDHIRRDMLWAFVLMFVHSLLQRATYN